MTRSMSLALILTTAIACGDKKSDPDQAPAADEPAATETFTTAGILEGTDGPQLLGPFAPARFGMTADELGKAVPVYADKGDYLSAKDVGLGFFVFMDGEPKTLTEQRVTIPAGDEKLVAAAWGAPTELTYRRKPARLWLDPEARIRAMATEGNEAGEVSLIIEPYLPAEAILGTEPGPLAIEKADRPFLGATADELKAAYPDNFEDDRETLLFMEWPQDEVGDAFKLELGVGDDGKVDRIQYWLHHGDNEALKKQLMDQLEAKYGPGKAAKTPLGRDTTQLGEAPPTVQVNETTGAWVIAIEPE